MLINNSHEVARVRAPARSLKFSLASEKDSHSKE